MAAIPAKSPDDLKYILAVLLGIDPESRLAKGILIVPVGDGWRAMSGHHDDAPDFRASVLKLSIELSDRYALDQG